MYLWRKLAAPRWVLANENKLQAYAGNQFVLIKQPGRKLLQVEIACRSAGDAQRCVSEFGGHFRKLQRNWLKKFSRDQRRRPLKIGKRLVLKNRGMPGRGHLIIPAGAAFGTGEHVTTAMSVRLLERLTRGRHPKLVIDLGTGSGILALAARFFGAKRVIGIDIDPLAISTAKKNARLNRINQVEFLLADVRRWRAPAKIDIVTANLFSELLIEVLPKLRSKLVPSGWLIFSGILRTQEGDLMRALRQHKLDIVHVRRRGKWIAMAATVV